MTRRHLYGLIIGLATFALGLGLVGNLNAPQPLSLCELDAHPEAYAGQTIRFRAVVYKTRQFIFGVSNCRSGEAPTIGIKLNPAQDGNVPLPESIISGDDKGNNVYLVDTEIVGHLDPLFGRNCVGPKYQVRDAKVERVFSVKQVGNREEAAQWVKSNSY